MPNIKNESVGLRVGESKGMVSKHHRSTAVAASPASDLIPPRRTGRVEELEAQIDKLRKRLRLAVIYGGDKTQEGAVIQQTFNPRSWKSYQAVAQDIADSLRRLGFNHVSLVADDMRLIEFLKREAIDFAWLNTGGVQGYNPMSHAAAMLEKHPVLALPLEGERYDCGSRHGFIEATIKYAIDHDDIRDDMLEHMMALLKAHGRI